MVFWDGIFAMAFLNDCEKSRGSLAGNILFVIICRTDQLGNQVKGRFKRCSAKPAQILIQ